MERPIILASERRVAKDVVSPYDDAAEAAAIPFAPMWPMEQRLLGRGELPCESFAGVTLDAAVRTDRRAGMRLLRAVFAGAQIACPQPQTGFLHRARHSPAGDAAAADIRD